MPYVFSRRAVLRNLKALVNIVFDRFKKKLKLCWLTCIIMFMWVNKQPKIQKIMKIMHSLWSYLWILNLYSYMSNNYSTVVYGGNIIRFSLFWSTKWLSWSSTFLHVHFYAPSDLLIACRTMQLRFFKLGTMLTYAFNRTVTDHLKSNGLTFRFLKTILVHTEAEIAKTF